MTAAVENGAGAKPTGSKPARLTKNQKRRLAKKNKAPKEEVKNSDSESAREEPQDNDKAEFEVEYVSAKQNQEDALFSQFSEVFAKFAGAEELCSDVNPEEEGAKDGDDKEDGDKNEEVEEDEDDDEKNQLSKRKRKLASRLSVAELKQLVARPDVVEAHDVTAADPRLLVYLKAYRNTVPVPRHWLNKRKYLQGKRGIEKPPFQLPDFISDTGIDKLRGAAAEQEEKQKAKQKARERMQPKMGKIDIDYQKLHDAFFRFQTKPKMSMHGDLYYEGKEFEVNLNTKTPGVLSETLKEALGMPEGTPPPWLINMQRYGPPPSYPNLNIPGLNAPIPAGCSFGYHPGGWGKPPVDEMGRPLYGDVFGATEEGADGEGVPEDKTRWGELEEEDEESEESEDEEMEDAGEEEAEAEVSGLETPLEDSSGISSVISDMTTPESIDLRKGARTGLDTEEAPELYKVLEQKEVSVGGAMYGSSHGYVVPGSAAAAAAGAAAGGKGKKGGAGGGAGMEVTLDASELEGLDQAALAHKFEQAQRAQEEGDGIMTEERKRKRKAGKSAESKSKKYKDFKF